MSKGIVPALPIKSQERYITMQALVAAIPLHRTRTLFVGWGSKTMFTNWRFVEGFLTVIVALLLFFALRASVHAHLMSGF